MSSRRNNALNNGSTGPATIGGMHPTMVRLYEAARSAPEPKTGPSAVGNALDESAQTVKNWEARGVSQRGLLKAQRVFGVNATWLETGNGPMRTIAPTLVSSNVRALKPNVEPGPDIAGYYPLISHVQAGNWTVLADNFQPGDAEKWIASGHNLGPHGYMLRVKGDSMKDPGGEFSFTEGMILHVNADLVPMPGQFAIARRQSTLEATFKRYVMIDDEAYLAALNPDWPREQKFLKLRPGDAWCGVVITASYAHLP